MRPRGGLGVPILYRKVCLRVPGDGHYVAERRWREWESGDLLYLVPAENHV
jgi:hypothetical protein